MPIEQNPLPDEAAPRPARPGAFMTFLSIDGVWKKKDFDGVVTLASPAGGGGSIPAPVLSTLTLSAATIDSGSANGTPVGMILGATAGSTLSLTDTAGGRFALSGMNVVAGSTPTDRTVSAVHTITVRETLAGATGSPRDTTLMISVAAVAVAPTLAQLALSGNVVAEGAAAGTAVGTLSGRTTGSTLSLIDTAGGRFALNGLAIVTGTVPTDYAASTSHLITVRETLAGASGSPRDTAITIAVTDVVPAVSLAALTLSNATLTEASLAGTLVGAVVGRTLGSTLTLANDAGGRFALNSGNLVAGATATNFDVSPSHEVVLRETLAGASGSPRDTAITVTILDATVLAPLSLTGGSIVEGTAPAILVGTISGITIGSTLSLTDTAGGRFALSGMTIVTGAVATDFSEAQTHSITVTETLAGSPNSPRVSTLQVTVTAAAPAVPLTLATAARFLNNATMGASPTEAEALVGVTNLDPWFAAQAAAPPSTTGITAVNQGQRDGPWMRGALLGTDQLRQRMAFALSGILVCADSGFFVENRQPLAVYGDLLVTHALGSFRNLIDAVSRNETMGVFLSHFKNQKADPATGRRPDENFAREVMELFTIGLYRLNSDGSRQLDANGRPIPNYTQAMVTGSAAVWTGLGPNPNGAPFSSDYERGLIWEYQTSPAERRLCSQMASYPAYHETGAKTIIDGIVIPAGGTVDSDIDALLDALVAHPSCAPFISRQLIVKLVTSNPSPAYISRVVAAWNATNGNLLQVARAILTDTEAMNPTPGTPSAAGKAQEPMLAVLRMYRAFSATSENGLYDNDQMHIYFNSELRNRFLSAPSVFNFYQPAFIRPEVPGYFMPELQLATESALTAAADEMARLAYQFRDAAGVRYASEFYSVVPAGTNVGVAYLNTAYWEPYAADPAGLVARMSDILTGGRMSPQNQAVIANAVTGISNPARRAVMAMSIFITSPQYTVN